MKKTFTKVNALALCIMLLAAVPCGVSAHADNSYTYIYDYWGDVQEAPNPYRVSTVIDSISIGLDKLDGKRMNKPQSLFVHNQDLYIADTFNNRIIQLHYDGEDFELIRDRLLFPEDHHDGAYAAMFRKRAV